MVHGEDGTRLQSLHMTYRRHLPLGILLLLTAGVFAASLGNGFVNLDDPLLVTENPHVQEASFANVGAVFSHYDPELYIPVTLLSYQLETWTLGSDAWHFHLVQLLLHLTGVTLVYRLALRLSKKTRVAVITAALFAIHPMNAEAVLWVSARKDLLSGVFALAALTCYLDAREGKRKYAYAWSVALFTLALGSKVSAVSVAVLLIALELWTGQLKTSWRRLVPFVLLAAIFGIVAVVGKAVVESGLGILPMVIMGFRSIFFYLTSFAAPGSLAASHVIAPAEALHSPLLPLWILTVVIVIVTAYRLRKRFPLASGGIGFFFLAIAPSLIHYTQGNGVFVLGAERYVYLASAGLFLCVATLSDAALAHAGKATRIFILVCAALVFCVLAELTLLRVFVFRDSVLFNIDTLQKHPADARAWYNLGTALEASRKPMQAELAYLEALKHKTDFADAAINLGILYHREGRKQESFAMFTKATVVRPDYFKGYFNLGVAFQNEKRYPEAETAYRSTLAVFPEYPEAHRNLAVVLGLQNKVKESMAEYAILADLDPGFRAELERLKTGNPE